MAKPATSNGYSRQLFTSLGCFQTPTPLLLAIKQKPTSSPCNHFNKFEIYC
ncbi:MAG: hypothetical protein OFPI_14950 [Osedax symbiont Rs2]|nr:MAG: hypothetical protein OFPI_14950 [Osedax symbiont Rs2]